MLSDVSIAVISDLHCRVGNGQDQESLNTYLLTDMLEKPPNRHPIAALKQLIDKEKLRSSLIICPGDLADKVELQGIKDGWGFVKQIKEKLGCAALIGTVGNHDVDSRNKKNLSNPFQYLKEFSTDFPTDREDLNLRYWTWHYCIYGIENTVIVNINTCHNHTSEEKAGFSGVSESLISDIQEEIKKIPEYDSKFKICCLHHHPIKHSNIDNYKDADVVERGDQLIDALVKMDFDLVVHGHKHDPQLRINDGLPILAAGSFSSMMNLKALGAENTFHIITLKRDGTKRRGIINTWVYGPKTGWTQKNGTYFPCKIGFGNTTSIEQLAEECSALFAGREYGISYKHLTSAIDSINYLDLRQQTELSRILKDEYRLAFSPEFPDMPDQLTKLVE